MHTNSEYTSLSGKGCNFLHYVNAELKKGAAKEIRVIKCKTYSSNSLLKPVLQEPSIPQLLKYFTQSLGINGNYSEHCYHSGPDYVQGAI